jgi:phage shock protein A
MGIFDRFSALLKSNINDLISKAEDPEKMLTQILVDMRGQLVKAKQQVASAIADEKRLRDQADAEFKQAQDWERRAMLAIQEGRDDLAKQALVRQAEHTGHGEQLAHTWEQHKLETDKLKNQLRDLNDKIEEAKRKKNLLIARQRRAQAQQRIAETMSSLSEKSAFEAFARMEERIENNERQIKASAEIDEEFTGDTLQREFKQLEKGSVSVSVDNQLLALKQKMGMLPARPPSRTRLSAPESVTRRPCTRRSSTRRKRRVGERRGRGAPLQVRAHPHRDGLHRPPAVARRAGRARLPAAVHRHHDLGVPRRAVRGAPAPRAHPGGWALAAAVLITLGGLAVLFYILVPPLIVQTRELVRVLPTYITGWEAAIDRLVGRVPALASVYEPGQHKLLLALYDQVAAQFNDVVPKVFGIVEVLISIFSVCVMGLYLAIHPALYASG